MVTATTNPRSQGATLYPRYALSKDRGSNVFNMKKETSNEARADEEKSALRTREADETLPAVLGVADHSGWAICVTVAAIGGLPAVVDRRRIELIEPGVPSQPYHHEAVGMPLPKAETLVARVRDSVMRTTLERLTGLCASMLPRYSIVAMTLRNPTLGFVPITVAEAHQSRHVMVRADGMMYHDAVSQAAHRLGLALERHERGAEILSAAKRFGVRVAKVEHFLRSAGTSLGPPWQKEHRQAAAAALRVLANRTVCRL
jgi:hypothetical protein